MIFSLWYFIWRAITGRQLGFILYLTSSSNFRRWCIIPTYNQSKLLRRSLSWLHKGKEQNFGKRSSTFPKIFSCYILLPLSPSNCSRFWSLVSFYLNSCQNLCWLSGLNFVGLFLSYFNIFGLFRYLLTNVPLGSTILHFWVPLNLKRTSFLQSRNITFPLS